MSTKKSSQSTPLSLPDRNGALAQIQWRITSVGEQLVYQKICTKNVANAVSLQGTLNKVGQ